MLHFRMAFWLYLFLFFFLFSFSFFELSITEGGYMENERASEQTSKQAYNNLSFQEH